MKLPLWKKLPRFKFILPKPIFKETPISTFLWVALVIFAFLLGMLTNKVIYLEQQLNNPSALTPQNAQAQAPAPQPTASPEDIKKLFDNDKNLVFGDKNSKNLIVEVADPSCPYCHAAAGQNPELNAEIGGQFTLESDGGTYVAPVPKIKELVEQGKAAFIWIYFPGHGNGEMGTKAMYCAKEQGKFWEVHNKLMTNAAYSLLNEQVKNDKAQSQTLVDFLADVADPAALKSCLDSGKYDAKLQEDVQTATKLGTNGTPGFFINTTPFIGAYSWNNIKSALK